MDSPISDSWFNDTPISDNWFADTHISDSWFEDTHIPDNWVEDHLPESHGGIYDIAIVPSSPPSIYSDPPLDQKYGTRKVSFAQLHTYSDSLQPPLHSNAPPSLLRRRTKSVDLVTQVGDLTEEVKIDGRFPVAHGGFSDIYRARWIPTEGEETKVALKLLRAFTRHEIDLDRARKRLNREVNVWKRLEHPNIASFYGVSFQLAGRPALVMQWYENGTVPQYLKSREKVNKLSLVNDIAQGLYYLHSLNPPVVHGDLKGNNALVTDEGRVVLSDFGLSKVIEKLAGPSGNTTSNMAAGSIRWQSPELLNFSAEDDDDITPLMKSSPSSDVWSFACTALEILTGNVPYYRQQADWVVLQAILKGKIPIVESDKEIPEVFYLVNILLSCWSQKPGDRPTMKEITSSPEFSF